MGLIKGAGSFTAPTVMRMSEAPARYLMLLRYSRKPFCISSGNTSAPCPPHANNNNNTITIMVVMVGGEGGQVSLYRDMKDGRGVDVCSDVRKSNFESCLCSLTFYQAIFHTYRTTSVRSVAHAPTHYHVSVGKVKGCGERGRYKT